MATNNTKQAFWVSIGSLFSFGFATVSSMILSRYFDKGDYGTYKQVMYVYNTMLMVFTLGLPKTFSYFLPRVKTNEAKNLINKITKLFFILGGLFSVVLYASSGLIADILNNPELKVALRYFSIVPCLMLPTMGLDGILATYKKTKFLAVYTICTRLAMLLCVAMPVMLFNLDYLSAIIGFVIASTFSFVLALALKNYPVKQFGNESTSVSYKDIFTFSLPLMYASLWGVLMNSADQFFVSRYFGSETFADFSNGSMELPFVGMVVSACSTVLSPIFSRMAHENVNLYEQAYPLWKSVYRKTAMLLYPLIVYCFVFADTIMVFLYGGKYDSSQYFFRIKVLTYIFSLIVFAPFLINAGKVMFYSKVTAIFAILIWPSEYIAVSISNSPYSIAIVSLLLHIFKIMVLLSMISNMFGVKLHQLFPIGLIAKIIVPSFIVLYIEKMIICYYTASSIFILLISLCIYAILYLVYSYFCKLDYLSIIKPLTNKCK